MSTKLFKKPIKLINALSNNEYTDERNLLGSIETYNIAFKPLITTTYKKATFASWSKNIRYRTSLKDFLIKIAELKIGLFEEGYIAIALLEIHKNKAKWIRPLDTWKRKTYNIDRQIISLARHLFCKYDDVPGFMDSIWFGDKNRREVNCINEEYIDWYIFLGQGGNIRKANQFPIPYTKKMSFNFLNAPDNYTISEAIYWGYIQGIGGNQRLVESICGTFVGESFRNFDFWSTVIQWMVNNPMLDHAKVQPIFDYIRHLKYDRQRVNYREQGVLEPEFSMKGRTADALLRAVDEWHQLTQGIRRGKAVITKWNPLDIKDFESISGANNNRKIWRISQLITSKELVSEGRSLNHCVGSYSNSCAAGKSAIFSMTRQDMGGTINKLTIEVSKTFNIGQIQGKNNNRKPTPHERNLINDWATQEKLTTSRWI